MSHFLLFLFIVTHIGEERDRERDGRDSPPKTDAPVSER